MLGGLFAITLAALVPGASAVGPAATAAGVGRDDRAGHDDLRRASSTDSSRGTESLTLLPGVSLCGEGVVYGAIVSLRLLAVLSAGALGVLTTYPSDLILAMTKLRGPTRLPSC